MPVQNMTFHHVGCVTNNMAESINSYKNSLGFRNISEVYEIKNQQVKVCFVETGPGIYLELVEPLGEGASLKKIMKSNNPYYHIGYLVDNVQLAIEELQKDGLYLVNSFRSEAFRNKYCAFLYTTNMHLIELIER